jgi:hypothetical protein
VEPQGRCTVKSAIKISFAKLSYTNMIMNWVNDNRRMTFTLQGEDAALVDDQDCHWELQHEQNVQSSPPGRDLA